MSRSQALLAQRVVRGDVLDRDLGEMEQERAQKAGAVLATDAVDDHASLRRSRDGPHPGADVATKVLEEDQIDVAGRLQRVRRGGRRGLDLVHD